MYVRRRWYAHVNTRPVWPAQPASQSISLPIGPGWPRGWKQVELDLALAGRAGGRIGRSLWAAIPT